MGRKNYDTKTNYRQTKEQYKIAYQPIHSWVKKYQEQGETGLSDRRDKRRHASEYSDERLPHLEVEDRIL